jgi:hypothetical protein
VAHLDGLGGTPVCRGTPVAHHWYRWTDNHDVPHKRLLGSMNEQQVTEQAVFWSVGSEVYSFNSATFLAGGT